MPFAACCVAAKITFHNITFFTQRSPYSGIGGSPDDAPGEAEGAAQVKGAAIIAYKMLTGRKEVWQFCKGKFIAKIYRRLFSMRFFECRHNCFISKPIFGTGPK